jgi:hypothetical protein
VEKDGSVDACARFFENATAYVKREQPGVYPLNTSLLFLSKLAKFLFSHMHAFRSLRPVLKEAV